jgi:hypothetical protein
MHSRPANTECLRWYIKKRRYVEAYTSLKRLRLRLHEIQAARDLYYITAQIEVEAELIGNTNHVRRFGELFTIPRIRRATLASSGYDRTIAIVALSLPASTPNNLDKKPSEVSLVGPCVTATTPIQCTSSPEQYQRIDRPALISASLFVGLFSRQVYQPRHRCPLAGL